MWRDVTVRETPWKFLICLSLEVQKKEVVFSHNIFYRKDERKVIVTLCIIYPL
jgi:hypothetical protein